MTKDESRSPFDFRIGAVVDYDIADRAIEDGLSRIPVAGPFVLSGGAEYMAARSCRAVVLKTIEFKDSSAIATMLTPEFGCVDCIAKGCRRPKNKFAAAIQPLNLIEVVYLHKNGRSIQTLAEAQLVEEHRRTKNDIELFAYASYMVQMAGAFVQHEQTAVDMFELLTRALDEIDRPSGNVKMFVAAVVARITGTAGFGLHLTSCVRCGNKLGTNSRLNFVEGGALCAKCPGDGSKVSREDVILMHRLGRTSAQDVKNMKIDDRRAGRILGMFNRYAAFLIEKDLPAWRFIESLPVAEKRLQKQI